MEYKVLESNGVEIENVDGAALNNFIAGDISGIVDGVLNECKLSKISSNIISIGTGELVIKGFRVKITEPYTIERSPSSSRIDYQIIARLTLTESKDVDFVFITRLPSSLVQNDLFRYEKGVYEVELAKFSTDTSGIVSVNKSLPIISSGSAAAKLYAAQAKEQAELARDAAEEISGHIQYVISTIPTVIGTASGVNMQPYTFRFDPSKSIVCIPMLLYSGEFSTASPIILTPTLLAQPTTISVVCPFPTMGYVSNFTFSFTVVEGGYITVRSNSPVEGVVRVILYSDSRYFT